MSKKVNRKVPKLRFSEFEGDWKILTIEEIASISSGGTPSRTESNYWNGDIPWITTGESSQSEIFDSLEKTTQKGLENSSAKIFPKNTILMAMYGQGKTRGQVSLLRIDAATSQNFAAITLKKGYSPEFVYCFLYQQYEHLRSLSNGNSHQNLSSGLVKSYRVPITSLAEQEKIASFLGAIDTRLTQLRRKHKLVQTYKRGVMQKLFSQQIRFKCDDGQPFPDWEEKRLESVCTMTSSKRIYLEEYVKDGIPFYRGKEVTELKQGKKPNGILYISRNKYEEIREKYGIPITGDILITAVGTLGNVWRINRNYDFYFKDGNLIWLKNISTNSIFLAILLQENTEELIKTSIGSTQKALTIVELKKISLNFPCLQEQEKIANFLTAIDKKIEAIAQQIDLTEQFKKGLLQKMFV